MKTSLFKSSAFLFGVSLLFSCTGSPGKNVSNDPEYADVYNNYFRASQPLYYYHYTHSDGSKSGYFLSALANPPSRRAKKEQNISEGAKVLVTKVFETPADSGKVNVMVQGKVFPSDLGEGLEYLAIWNDIKPALKKAN